MGRKWGLCWLALPVLHLPGACTRPSKGSKNSAHPLTPPTHTPLLLRDSGPSLWKSSLDFVNMEGTVYF